MLNFKLAHETPSSSKIKTVMSNSKMMKPCPNFDSKPKDYGDYVTRVVWWTQSKAAEPGEMGLLLAQQLTGPAFQAVENMDQSLLVEAELVEPGITRLSTTGRPLDDQDDEDDGDISIALGTPTGVLIPLGVYHLIRVLNDAGFRLSAADEAFAAHVRFQELRRGVDERMSDYIFRFDMSLAETRQHGANAGDDTTLARYLLIKADISLQDQRQAITLAGRVLSLSAVREALRLLFATEDEQRAGSNSGGTRAPATSVLATRQVALESDLVEVEMEVRFPGETAFFTRKVLLQQRKPGIKKPLTKKPWEPGCWN